MNTIPNGVQFNQNYPTISNSNDLYKRAQGLIPSVTQTLAKGPTQFVKGIAPKYLLKGSGSHVWDVDGNEYIDYNMGIGPLSLGYSNDRVDSAIKAQLEYGITFSLMHPLEVEVAELIQEVIPNAESVRFSKTGADVTSAAIRAARAYTGKDKVLCSGYHGWHDWYVGVTPRPAGIPKDIRNLINTFEFNNIESFTNSITKDTAAVILEPVVFTEPKDEFLNKVRDICTKNDIVLIFDEMWTGFRMDIGGAQEYFGIIPDLATYSKAVANGMPLSILTGRMEIMNLFEDEVFFYTTFGGEVLSLAAAKATILEIIEHNVPSYMRSKGSIIKEGYNQIAAELGLDFTKCIGYDFRSMVTFDEKAGDPLLQKSLVQQELIKRGILWSGFHNLSFSHNNDDIDYTLLAYKEVLTVLKKAVEENKLREMIHGEPVQPVFRKTGSFNTKPVNK